MFLSQAFNLLASISQGAVPIYPGVENIYLKRKEKKKKLYVLTYNKWRLISNHM